MRKEKKLAVYEDSDRVEITYKWYSPMAFFFLFFTVFWNGFLFFWYSLAFVGGASWIMVLFPILHVAAGIYLIYYTLCLFLNKTFVDIADDKLTVYHSPIPWWKGNRKIRTNNIEQLYVSEKKSEGNNGPKYSYELRAKLGDQSDVELLSIENLTRIEAQEMEDRLEKFMGIDDLPVKGEYREKGREEPQELPRRVKQKFANAILGPLFLSKEKDQVQMKDETLDIVSITQYDWDDGNSDKYFQLLGPENEARLLFMEQDKAILQAFQERKLKLFETNLGKFHLENPPPSIEVAGREYFPVHFKVGKAFISGEKRSLPVKQWHYATKDEQSFIRVVSFQKWIRLFLGEKLQASDFEDILDLEDRPEKKPEMRERGWDEGDLV